MFQVLKYLSHQNQSRRQHPAGKAPLMTDTSQLPVLSREWHLVSRPVGVPKPEDFALVEAEVKQPGEGQVLVRNKYLSVDPYMRGRMSAAKSYVAPFELGKVMQGGAVGEVVASNAEGIEAGDHVLHFFGWREFAVVDAKQAVKVDPEAAPLSTYLGVLGMTGLTAYAGLLRTASFKEGDSVFVSGAAGAVGSQVGQIAKLKGASRVIGSAGSDEKVKLLVEEYGFDAAFNYKNGPVSEQLREAAPTASTSTSTTSAVNTWRRPSAGSTGTAASPSAARSPSTTAPSPSPARRTSPA